MTDVQQSRIEELLGQMDAAYATGSWHSFLGNLADVPDEAWDWVPPQGARTIRELVLHVGWCKREYENATFGDGKITFTEVGLRDGASKDEMLTWLDDAHRRWRDQIAKLTDSELDEERRSIWQGTKPVRYMITTLLHHDVYHAGEVNHIRALYMKNDDWD